MAKRINLSLTRAEAKTVYEALTHLYLFRVKAALRVSGLRAPTQESLAESAVDIQRRLAVKLEGNS